MQINLSTRELRAFVTLAEQRSFTRAASLVHLSQPAFSSLIRSLEEAIGARLFDRTTRSVELTTEGLSLLDAARRLLAEAEAAVSDVRDFAARRRGRVAIAALPSLAAGWLPGVLAAYRADFPGIEIDVADVLSDECIERVRLGRAEIALASSRRELPELRTEPLCEDRFHLVCRKDHPLAAMLQPVPISAIANQPIVQLARSSSVRQVLEAAVYPTKLNSVLELEQLASVAGMVRAGLGVAVVPTLTLFHFDDRELIVRDLDAPTLVRQLFLVRRSDRALSTAARALYERIVREPPLAAL